MEHYTRTARLAATATGALLLAVSAGAVIDAAHQTGWQAAITAGLAVGAFIGSALVGRIWQARQFAPAIIVAAALICAEGFNLVGAGKRIITEAEHEQATVRSASGAAEYALGELVKAQAAKDAADRAAVSEAAKPGCKQNCRALIEAQVAAAKIDLDVARQRVQANPKPTASASPLADRLGVSADAIDLATALMVAVAINGLAAGLIAYGTHGQTSQLPGNSPTVAKHSRAAQAVPATVANDTEPLPPKGGNRRQVATKAAAEADVIQLVGRGQPLPEQSILAARWGCNAGTASKWLQDFERRGLISRQRVGRCKAVAAA